MKQPEAPCSLPPLTDDQRVRLEHFQELALAFNTKLNLYSDASAEHFWRRHVMHSLTLAVRPFPAGARVVDWGTGGGLPGIPLAVLFPQTEFVLVDSVRKKILAVQTMARRLRLDNVTVWHGRAETWVGEATHSVSRATAPLSTLWQWHGRVARNDFSFASNEWPPGLYCLKGGNLSQELAALSAFANEPRVDRTPLDSILGDPFFKGKTLVVVLEELYNSLL